MRKIYLAAVCIGLLPAMPLRSQESPYFVTYDHHMEEPGNLEIATSATIGVPRAGQHAFFAPYTELEYGVLGRWTSELYLEGQSTASDSSIFTGWRLENRVRPFEREHWINPVLYFEFEDISEADKIQKEIVGHSPDLSSPNGELHRNKNRELEWRLILSSNPHDWNISENFIFEKNLSANEGVEFGYAFGASRPLASMATPNPCRLCRENFSAGVEFYGGLGSTRQFGLQDTAHYAAPVLAWQVSDNSSLRFSPGFGLTHESAPVLFRVGYVYEIQGLGRKLAQWFGGTP